MFSQLKNSINSIIVLLLFLGVAQAQGTRIALQHNASSGNGREMVVTGLSIIGLTVQGSASSSIALAFEVQQKDSNGIAVQGYGPASCTKNSDGSYTTTGSASNTTIVLYRCAVAGFDNFRARITGGSGTVSVSAYALANVSGATSPIGFSSTSTGVLSPTGTNFLVFSGSGDSLNEGIAYGTQSITGSSGTLTQLWCAISAAPGTGKSYAFLVRKNGVDTTLTCTIANAATSCGDTAHSFSVVQDDLLSIKVTPSGSPTAAAADCKISGPTGSTTITSSTPTDLIGILTGNGSTVNAIATTGTGLGVLQTSPTLTTPILGVATATSLNGLTITSSTGTLTVPNGTTLNTGAGGTLGSAAFTAAGAYEVPLTFSTGLTRSTNTITVNAINLAGSGPGGVSGKLPLGNGGACDFYATPGTSVLQAIINAAPSNSVICLASGTYAEPAGLTIGNGTSTALSTQHGIVLRASAFPAHQDYSAHVVTIDCSGMPNTVGTACITFQGPYHGGGLYGITVTGSSTNSHVDGVKLLAASWVDLVHVFSNQHGRAQYNISGRSSCSGACGYPGSANNTLYGSTGAMPNVAGAYGFAFGLDGLAEDNQGIQINMSASQSGCAVYFGYSTDDRLYGLLITASNGKGSICYAYDNSSTQPGFPSNDHITGLTTDSTGGWSTLLQETGTVSGTARAWNTIDTYSLNPVFSSLNGTDPCNATARMQNVRFLSCIGGARIGDTTEVFTGFRAQTPNTLDISNPLLQTDSTGYGALILGNNTSGTTSLVSALMFINRNTGASEKRLAQLTVAADGAVNSGRIALLMNNAGTVGEVWRVDHTGLQTFGGQTTSFPALKRSGARLQHRLGDDSAYGGVDALDYQAIATGFAVFKGDGTTGRCDIARDTDGTNWSKGKWAGGVLTITTDADGICN